MIRLLAGVVGSGRYLLAGALGGLLAGWLAAAANAVEGFFEPPAVAAAVDRVVDATTDDSTALPFAVSNEGDYLYAARVLSRAADGCAVDPNDAPTVAPTRLGSLLVGNGRGVASPRF